jgi:hypothetical protein
MVRNLPYGFFADMNQWPTVAPIGDDQAILTIELCRKTREAIVVKDALYIDPDGVHWWCTAGTKINGLSVPRLFWRLCWPYEAKSREASAFHDRYCVTKERPSPEVHRMFYYSMRANGMGPFRSWIRWVVVRAFGPRF